MAEKNWSSELTAYIDGALGAEDVKALEAALAADPALRGQEQRLRRSIELVEALPAPAAASARLRAQVLSAIAAEPEPSWGARLSAWLRGPRLVPVSFAIAAAATAVLVWPRRGEEPGDEEQLLVSLHLELVEDLDLVGVGTADDLEVIASLHELEGLR
jgi:anti-sigma factor RsiW